MQQSTSGVRRHSKSKILLIIAAALMVGFFAYKYSYIYLERQKYNKVEVDISKVADALRSQGIETTPFENCERAQVKFGKGFLSCHVGIVYEGSDERLTVKEPLEKFMKSVNTYGFVSVGVDDELNPTRHPIVVGSLSYFLDSTDLGCSLSYDKVDDSDPPYTLIFSCGKSSKFAIFDVET